MKRLAAVFMAAGLLLATALASAQSSTHAAAAEESFRAGRALIKQHRYKEACERLLVSQQLDPAVGTLLSIGECYTGQGKTASAWLAYRSAVAIAASHSDPRSASAEERANALEPQLSRLLVHMSDDASDARITVDGESFTRDAFRDPVPIDPGDHAIVVGVPGFKAWKTHVTVGALPSVATVEVPRLEVLPDASGIARARSRAATQRIAGLAVGGAGLVVAGVGSILGLQAIVKIRDARSACPTGATCSDAGAVQENQTGKSFADASSVLVPVGAAFLVGGAVLFFTARAPRGTEIGAEMTPGGARVRVGWSW